MSYRLADPVTVEFETPEEPTPVSRLVFIFAASILLGLGMMRFNSLATLHVFVTVLVGLYFAVFDHRVERVAYVGAYIVGIEVLWRMSFAQTFWETGKYATALIFGLALLRQGRLRIPIIPLTYFLALLPSTLMILIALGFSDARDGISFNLSGPLALAVSAAFFYNVSLSRKHLQYLLLALVSPVLAIAGAVLYYLLINPYASYTFRGGSNYGATASFGPNQVSSILGLGTLMLLFFLMEEGASWTRRLLFWVAALWLLSQCILTFSRGGLYNIAVGVLLAMPFLIQDPRARAKLLIAAMSIALVGNFLILPRLETFTFGRLSGRYENVDTTGRLELISADMELWQQYPILGVGPGQSQFFRISSLGQIPAHTEFSRLPAEHGLFGFAALILLFIAGGKRILLATSPLSQAVTAALVGWSLFDMFHGGMRIVAPAFVFGLTYARFFEDQTLSVTFLATSTSDTDELPATTS